MKILSADQIRQADAATIAAEGIASAELMERAARAFVAWFENKFAGQGRRLLICCGPGNNGGDGLAIARLLAARGYEAQVWIVANQERFSPDFVLNRGLLPAGLPVKRLAAPSDIPELPDTDFIFDALFGTGLSRPLQGVYAAVITCINALPATRVAIDLPSGLFADAPSPAGGAIVEAHYTLGFELPKLAYLLAQNHPFVGTWCLAPIGLSPGFLDQVAASQFLLGPESLQQLLKPRGKFSHKGTYGHALLLAGSYGKMGAATLASRACLRSGVGLLTVHCPAVGYQILQISVPEAMTLPDARQHHLSELPPLTPYQAIGVGPGLGQGPATGQVVAKLLQTARVPLVLDADALNLVAAAGLLPQLPPRTILTPHPKEFERLAGPARDDFHRLELLRQLCRTYQCYVVLKGGHTCIGSPEGNLYFNATGNPGMATGGTGDVLTGILTALVAQGYPPGEACQLGVYLHGLAGDLAKIKEGEVALVASDLIAQLGPAFEQLRAASFA
ncbi:MAG: NAD(P)H-hydrate dehydratase [Adhaeribacter sp.]